MKRRQFIKSMGMGMASCVLPALSCSTGVKKLPPKPNIIFIMTDDHASQAISCYGSSINITPNIDRIASQGVRFNNCFCTNSICAPSRAVILTGVYSHINGVRDNVAEFDGGQRTFPKLLQQHGYLTAMIGKWHLKSDPTGFDYWNILPGQGQYYNPDFNEMGTMKRYTGYATDLITDITLDYLNAIKEGEKPFLLMLHHKAPHRTWQPPLRYLHKYDNVTFPEPPTLFDMYATRSAAARDQEMTLREHMLPGYDLKMEAAPQRLDEAQRTVWDAAYAPRWRAFLETNPQGDDLVRWKYQRYIQDYCACIDAVDDSVGRVLDSLDESGLSRNTIVFYTSDQGFYLGEHGWFDKRFMYEESLRMPLLVRFPGHIAPHRTCDHLVSNLDFAPTFLELAHCTIPADMQGRPLVTLLQNKNVKEWRSSIYYHYYEYPAVHMVKRHYGVRTRRYKLIHFYYDIDAWELYDLEEDPHELNNLYDDPAYAQIVTELKGELRRLQEYYGDSDQLAEELLKVDLEGQKVR